MGRLTGDIDEIAEARHYRKAFCQNCGLCPMPLGNAPVVSGDKVVVNKAAFLVREPSRWEIVVFRLLGTFFVKRLLGLPGEEICIQGGDVYVDGKLARKTLAEVRTLRLPVFEHDFAPSNDGWRERWAGSDHAWDVPGAILVDGLRTVQTLTYLHYCRESGKCEPIRDEYAYNVGTRADAACVHDFSIDMEVRVTGKAGVLALRLTDGHDWVEALLPVGSTRPAEALSAPIDGAESVRKIAASREPRRLTADRPYRVELAFVDRRMTLAVDGEPWLCADLPAALGRTEVVRPFQVRAEGIQAELRHFRLFRDVHYTQHGNNAVGGKSVRLSANQYFMLGDNSPYSEDSRFWPDDGRIDRSALVGSVLYVSEGAPARR